MKLAAPVLALFTAIFALAAPATAAAAPATEHAVRADLNGDGTLDRVIVRSVPNNPNEQFLVATVGQVSFVAREALDAFDTTVQPLRVVDINADGRDEVVLTESVGANTDRLSVWGLFDTWRPVRMADQSRLRLWVGGGSATFDNFGCDTISGQRKLVTVRGAWDLDREIYTGERITYSVGFGTVEQWSHMSVEGSREAPGFQASPRTCE
jgi:hypothetical protein